MSLVCMATRDQRAMIELVSWWPRLLRSWRWVELCHQLVLTAPRRTDAWTLSLVSPERAVEAVESTEGAGLG